MRPIQFDTMKKGILALVVFCGAAFTFTACDTTKKENTETSEQTEQTHQADQTEQSSTDVQSSETTVAYACPMKCEGDKTYTDKDQKCPKCGMALAEVKAAE